MARSDATAITVRVLEGPSAGQVLTLEGRALPYRAGAGGVVSFGGDQRVKTIWYPGSPVATQLINGPTLQPTTFNGVWKDRYLGEDAALGLYEAFDRLREQGVQVRVLWGPFDYQGVIRTFTIQPGIPTGGLGDIGWSMTCEWNSRGGRGTARRVLTAAGSTVRDDIAGGLNAFSTLRQLAEDVVETVETLQGLPAALTAGLRNQVNDLRDEGDAPAAGLADTVAELAFSDAPPGRLLEGAVTFTDAALDLSGETGDVLANVWAGSTTPLDDAAELLRQYLARADVVDASFAAMDALWAAQMRAASLTRPEVRVVVRPTQGQDLRELALRFYGDADRWTRLASANGLTQSVIPTDVDELEIPMDLPAALEDGYAGLT